MLFAPGFKAGLPAEDLLLRGTREQIILLRRDALLQTKLLIF